MFCDPVAHQMNHHMVDGVCAVTLSEQNHILCVHPSVVSVDVELHELADVQLRDAR